MKFKKELIGKKLFKETWREGVYMVPDAIGLSEVYGKLYSDEGTKYLGGTIESIRGDWIEYFAKSSNYFSNNHKYSNYKYVTSLSVGKESDKALEEALEKLKNALELEYHEFSGS